jgi:hypothetical protein
MTPEMACRRCLVPLNTTGVPPRYIHPLSADQPDHLPEPVPVAGLETVARRCDFCADPHPLWTLVGGDVTAIALGEHSGLLQQYGDRWAACATCLLHIDRGDTDRIVDRAIAHPDLAGDSRVRWEISRLHTAFLDERRPGRTLITTTAWPATPLRARDLPKFRDRLTRLYRGPDHFPGLLGKGDLRAELADGLDQATLYWIDPDFTDLAEHAAAHLPDTTAGAAPPPGASGLLLWARPIPPDELAAVGWTATPDTCRVTRYRSVGGGLDGLALQRVREEVGWLVPTRTMRVEPRDPVSAGDALAVAIATWLLIDQKLAEEQPVPLEPQIRKAYARTGRTLPAVRLVGIRGHARSSEQPTSAEPSSRDYRGRFWVTGHWRNQPYGPGRALRRPVYIHPFLKGPDDQPIRQGTAVRVLGSTPSRAVRPSDVGGRADA